MSGVRGASRKNGASSGAAQPAWLSADYDFIAQCWDDARRCFLYDLYFGEVVDKTQKTNLAMEIIVAVTASGGVISSWALWQDEEWRWLWTMLVGAAAIVSVIKPIMRLDLRIERFSKLLAEYRALSLSLQALIFDVQQSGRLTQNHRDRQSKLAERIQHAAQQWPARMDQPQIAKLQGQVNREMPPNRLWAPPVPGKHPDHPLPAEVAAD